VRSATFIGGPTVSISTSDSTKSEPVVLVLIEATEDGSKEFLAVVDGYRESTNPGVNSLAAQTPGSIGGAQTGHL
jgi:hypothetical protein